MSSPVHPDHVLTSSNRRMLERILSDFGFASPQLVFRRPRVGSGNLPQDDAAKFLIETFQRGVHDELSLTNALSARQTTEEGLGRFAGENGSGSR